MRSKLPGRPIRGDLAPLDADLRHVRGAPRRGPDRGRGEVAGQQAVAAPGEHLGQHADRAARLEGAAIPARRELREADRVLAPLIPAVLEPPRVAGGLVHGVEVAAPGAGGDRGGHRSSTSCAPGEMGHDPGRQYRSGRGPAAGELAGEGLDGRTLPGRDAGGSGIWHARCQGTRGSAWLGPVPHPDRVAQHGPAAAAAARRPRGPRPRDRRAHPAPTARGRRRNRRTARAGGGQLVLAGGHRGVGEPQPDHFGLLGAQHARERRPTPRSGSARSRQDRNPGARPRRR